MGSSSTVFSSDRLWKMEAKAFKSFLGFYKSIGTEVTVYHWEKRPKFLFLGGGMGWVKRPADSIYIANHYSGLLANLTSSAAARTAYAENVDYLEEKLWAVGVAVKVVGPPVEGGSVGGGASLEIRSVEGRINVRIGREFLTATVEAR